MIPQRTNTLRISTPDGVVFDVPLAGPVVRGAALLIDLLVILALLNVISTALTPLAMLLPDIGAGMIVLLYFVVQSFYFMLCELLWSGRTLGKRLFQLRVIDDRGLRLRPSQVVLRNLMRAIDVLPVCYLVAGVTAFLNQRGQRLGDLAAGTVVVRTPPPVQDLDDLLAATRFNSFRSYPHLEARLRQLTAPHEVMLAIDALRRRESLDPPARVDVYARIADHFREKLRFPAEAADNLTDEQYLRNVVDSVCRRPGIRRDAPPR